MITIQEEDLYELYFTSYQIPIGVIGRDGKLLKLFMKGGERQTQKYIEDSRRLLRGVGERDAPVICIDESGSGWCLLPVLEEIVLLGPVQTGGNPAFSYEGIPEYSWESFRQLAGCFAQLLCGKGTSLRETRLSHSDTRAAGEEEQVSYLDERAEGEETRGSYTDRRAEGEETRGSYTDTRAEGEETRGSYTDTRAEDEGKSSSYIDARAAEEMFRTGWDKNELSSFDNIYDCVRTGDLLQLNAILESGVFLQYLNRIMADRRAMRTMFQFNLAKSYHTALEVCGSPADFVPIIALYQREEASYNSAAAYKSGMQRMLYDFTKYVGAYRDERYSALVNKAQIYIKDNLYTQITVEEVARHCLTSVSTLQHRFKEETGMSVSEKIRSRKIDKACYFLKHTNLPCSDIAFKMGYCSQSYFISQFRKVMGMTPTAYRNL